MSDIIITKIPGTLIVTGAPDYGSDDWEEWNHKFDEPDGYDDDDDRDDDE